jgi:hypothetical protein
VIGQLGRSRDDTIRDKLTHDEAQIDIRSEDTTKCGRTYFRGVGWGNGGIGTQNETPEEFTSEQHWERASEELDKDATSGTDHTSSKCLRPSVVELK